MKIHELANKNYESIDEIVVDIAESIKEVDELEKERNDYKDESERLKNEVADLKERNLKLLSMMPSVPDEAEDNTEDVTEIKIEDVYI